MISAYGKILLIGSNLWYLGEGMFGPLFAVFVGGIGGDILDISWAWALYLGVQGILMIQFGKLADKMNPEKLMVFGYGLNALFTFSYLLVSAPVHLFLVQIGLGVAGAIATPTWNALYDKHSDDKFNGYIWGSADGQALIVTAIAMVIGGYIVSLVSFKALFITMGTIQVI